MSTPIECADAILALINSKPRTPTRDEIVAVLEGGGRRPGWSKCSDDEAAFHGALTKMVPLDWNFVYGRLEKLTRG